MDNQDLEQLKALIGSPIKNITRDTNTTVIEFENGVVLPLYGGSFEIDLNVPVCTFCGEPGGEEPLFTTDDKNFLCKNCAILAVETFVQNGVSMDFQLGDKFSEVAEQISKLSKNLDNVKSE